MGWWGGGNVNEPPPSAIGESSISSPRPAFLLVSTKNADSVQVRFLSVRRVLIDFCQPALSAPKFRKSQTFKSDLTRVLVLTKNAGYRDEIDDSLSVWGN